MLLWVFILSLFTAGVSRAGLPVPLKTKILIIQAFLLTCFFAFILFTSNPFLRQPAFLEGQDLNPILQDIGLAIHPPMLYLGYVGFSITFSFALAALHDGKLNSSWARWVRPWALSAWMFLTAGIALGSYWAYYELGWGGWWFWDPVENASFLPWLTGTAFLHSVLVLEKRGGLILWTLLLAILTFSLSLLGTFLVRSGILTSVHSFASDPSRGIFILLMLCVFIGGALLLFSTHSHRLISSSPRSGLFAPFSREGALIFNNLILCTAASSILLGTLYPLIYEALSGGSKISVGAPFFNLIFSPLMIPLLIVLPLAPLLSWKQSDFQILLPKLYFLLTLSFFVFALFFSWNRSGPWLAPFGLALSVWVMVGSFSEIFTRSGFSHLPIRLAFTRFVGLPKSMISTALAHFGMGVCLLGIVSVSAYEDEWTLTLSEGDSVPVRQFTLTHLGLESHVRDNYQEQLIHLSLTDGETPITTMSPSQRTFPSRQTQTIEASIYTFWFSQIYITLGETIDDLSTITIRWKPLVLFIWLGAIFMILSGIISLMFRYPMKKVKK